MRGPVPKCISTRMRRCVEPASGPDRDRQTSVHAGGRRRSPRSAGHRCDGGRHRRHHARRQDGGRRVRQATQGRRRTCPSVGPARSTTRRGLRVRIINQSSAVPIGAVHACRQRTSAREGKTLPADCIIFDLEDAVAPDAKVSRSAACAAAASGAYGTLYPAIRRNGLDTQWQGNRWCYSQLDRLCGRRAEGRLGGYVDEVAAQLDSAGAPSTMTVWAMLEDPDRGPTPG